RKIEIKELPPAAVPDPAVVGPLRALVAAKERSVETTRAQVDAGRLSKMDLVTTEIDLTEARIRLAQAERNPEAVLALLKELVAHRQEERKMTAVLVEVGRNLPEELSKVDALLAEAKARLAQARSEVPPAAAPVPRRKP